MYEQKSYANREAVLKQQPGISFTTIITHKAFLPNLSSEQVDSAVIEYSY